MKILAAVLCFLLGHEEPRRIDADGLPCPPPESEPWPCARCGHDCRPTWVIQLDTEDRIERLYMEVRRRRL